MTVLSKSHTLIKKYPIIRGVITYAITWPVANLAQQTIMGKSWKTYDWAETWRFSIFGGLYVAPTLYGWVRLGSIMWPKTNLKTALIKTGAEQLSYGPFAVASFLFVLSLLEGRNLRDCCKEVQHKFFPTFQLGICVWPMLQVINYSLIKEKNRVPFVSCCSLIWTIFLSYVKSKKEEDLLLSTCN